MFGVHQQKIQIRTQKALIFWGLLFLFLSSAQAENKETSQTKKNTLSSKKIKIQEASPVNLNQKIEEQRANPQLKEIFHSTLFDHQTNSKKHPSLTWLKDTKIQEKRSQIIGSQSNTFETWWKIGLDGFLLKDRADYTEMIRSRINAKLITQFTESFFAEATFELLASTGVIQKIWQRAGESEISQREILLLFKVTDWFNLHLGAINQDFLHAPLLLGDIPFPSVVESISFFNNKKNHLSLALQQAIPTTFSASNTIYTQKLANTPLLLTGSLFWNHDSRSYYQFAVNGTLFHYNLLPDNIANDSLFYGNTIIGESNTFKYRYTGFYIGLEPSFQIIHNLGVKLKVHYIHNLREDASRDGVNKGILYSLETPFDMTKNIRITPRFEYFVNQPDSSVGYYNSERYGHSDRAGYLGELILNLYERNMEIGFRHLRSNSVKEGGFKQGQTYYLIFLRTKYAKI